MARSSGTWKKGQGGKPKGALNRTTKEAHEFFNMIMNRQMNRLETALANIDDDEKYLNSLAKLLQYYMPRKADITSGDEKIQIKLPDIIIK